MLKISYYFLVFCAILITINSPSSVANIIDDADEGGYGEAWAPLPLVKREERRILVSTEYGEISAARVTDNIDGATTTSSYLLHFFTLDPNSLLLPLILHSDMVFCVHTGSGKLSWTEEDDLKSTDLRRGDVYRLQEGAVFFIQSYLETETERQKLRIHAIFANSDKDLHEPATGPYSSIRDMVLGFNKKVLQAAFMVPEEDIEELLNGTTLPAIIHGVSKTKRAALETEARLMGSLLGSRTYNIFELNKKKEKRSAKLFNLFKEDKDFENCNGWSTTVTRKKLSALKGTGIGVFMVNLTTGSMMGPHWNPMATEIAVVLQGRGMFRVVCSSIWNETGCRNMRYEVEEGDIFVVPRFHAMAQMSFNNETLVFVGFSTSTKRNHPQFLAGQASVFRTLDKDVLAMSFNITNTTMDRLLASQQDSVILGCISCAEEELRIMEEEMEKEKEKAREREEEEARKREEQRRREEEEAREREEEEARREEEERKRREEEEERKRQEEEAARREEEERRRREEEEEEEEEAAKRREEEEERKRQEEEAARREEEESRRQEEEEEEAARRREEEEERKRQEEETREREEEAARRQEEERRRQEEAEEVARRREEEEERKRQEEEAREREEEAARREEEERRRQEEEAAAAAKRREEEERQREEEEARWREQQHEEARQRQQQEEQEEQEEARQRQQEQEEEEARRREEGEQEEQQGRRTEEEQAAEEERRRGRKGGSSQAT